ncbi:DUF2283 domain-containing protein [Candidatus Bathyarchaeota archaeon]|nr:DUF2283 domain-containing protein [Candidatus Bathyarchaeota archaeon]
MASLAYDSNCNALYIRLKRGKVAESEPVSDNVILDLNKKGEILGIEVLGPIPIDTAKFSNLTKIIAEKQGCHPKAQIKHM